MSQAAHTPALLVLEDGRAFAGTSYGATGETFGEAVFTTGMTGYQETLTDPSYHRQIVTQTAPHIGNTGVNDEDDESQRIWVAGYVVRDPARVPSNWRATRSLDDQLKAPGHRRHLRDRHPRADPAPARARRDAGRDLDRDPRPGRAAGQGARAAGDGRLRPGRAGHHRRRVRRTGRGGEAVHRGRPRPRDQVDDAEADGRARHRGARDAGHRVARGGAGGQPRRHLHEQRAG